MGISFLLLAVFQVVSIAAIGALWVKITKIQNQEDQRLSKGLQLLQSKLAVLEDLSDRTEVQVNQLVAILEGKIRDIQAKLTDADKVIGKIEKNIEKSLEVANIFQDKIPHQEILERQYTKKYVKAAQLAHAGHSAQEISQVVELTQGEIELIVKLNRDHLQFDVSELPEWAKIGMDDQQSQALDINIPSLFEGKSDPSPLRSLETAFELPTADNKNLRKLGDQFRTAMAHAPAKAQSNIRTATEATTTALPSTRFIKQNVARDSKLLNTFSQFFDNEPDTPIQISEPASEVIMQGGKKMTIKPFLFKRIEDDAGV